jgi:hypothetical protein
VKKAGESAERRAAHNVGLTADPTDGLEYSNEGPDGGPVVPPGVPPAPMAFDGQLVQMDVVAVAAMN